MSSVDWQNFLFIGFLLVEVVCVDVPTSPLMGLVREVNPPFSEVTLGVGAVIVEVGGLKKKIYDIHFRFY